MCALALTEPFGQQFVVDKRVLAARSMHTMRQAAPEIRVPPVRPADATSVTTPSPAADIAVVDGDAALRDQLGAIFHSIGLRMLPFDEPEGLLERGAAASVRCVVTDVRTRGFSGLDLQSRLLAQNIHTPIIFMTAHGDIKMSVRAMKAGAVDFLTKPLREQDLLDAVMTALDREQRQRQAAERTASLQARAATLTPRETRVLALVTAGLMNKQIAGRLGITEVTVKMHRAGLMRKMAAGSLAELTLMAAALDALPHGEVPEWDGPPA
jgi:FixJ family two-component response regulator